MPTAQECQQLLAAKAQAEENFRVAQKAYTDCARENPDDYTTACSAEAATLEQRKQEQAAAKRAAAGC
jgi:hypothetical protein